jgi:hypothetical protein
MDVDGWDKHDARQMADPSQLWQRGLVPHVVPGHRLTGARLSLRSSLYRSARILGDVQAGASGNPKRIERRAKNNLVGRVLGRTGFWRSLWR